MIAYHTLVFILIYLWEIALSTFRLAITVLSPDLKLNPRFIEVPLDLKQEFPRFLFACLISMTPGTMSVGLDPDRGILVVHVLHAPDPEKAIREMKHTFEQPLIRIFGRS
jgi:multicomponent K+:H+ antiporter subunit E